MGDETHHDGRRGVRQQDCPAQSELGQPLSAGEGAVGTGDGSDGGFSLGLIRMALIRQNKDRTVYILARKSMTIQFYLHSVAKRPEAIALLDSEATENFIDLTYA